jgi:glycosyltransferase involved in cell wall biosynthesis
MPKPLRLLHVVSTADPRSGGPIAALQARAAACRPLGVEIDIATLDPPTSPWLTTSETRVIALGREHSRWPFSTRLVPWLRRHARGYDAVLANGLWQQQTLAVWWALRRSAVPYFVFPHGMLDPWSRAQPLKFLKKELYWLALERRVLRDARAVLFTSEEERRLARRTFWPYCCREVVVPYGIRAPTGNRVAEVAAFRPMLGLAGGRRFLLFLGRLHPKKGCDLLLSAFRTVSARAPDLDLVLAGPDEIGWSARLRVMVEALGLAGRVHWPGMLVGDAKWGALRAAEALVLPSHQENFGLVVAEALACGTPVLLSRRVNIWREVVEDGAGLAAENDLAGTTDLLASWLTLDEARRDAMARQAAATFRERFDLTTTAPSYVRVLTELIGPGPRQAGDVKA